ncbi:MAG: DUF507 family protein [bacterium]
MSRLSDERISKLAHNIINNLISKQLVDPTRRGELLSVIKNGFLEFEKFNDYIDARVRERIASLSRKVPEGSEEWKILYAKYKEEILKKQKIGSIKI